MSTIYDRFAVLKPNLEIDEINVCPEIYQKLKEQYGQFHLHTLISAHQFTADWNVWEKHPAGDEIVILIRGRVEFLIHQESITKSIVLEESGSFLVIPKDTWHTAKIDQFADIIFITPGEGTQAVPALEQL